MQTDKTTGIVYWIYGSKADDSIPLPVVMIHGHGGDHRGLATLAEHLGGRVYVPDLPGFGDSPELEEYSIASYAHVLERFVSSLGIEKYYLVGHSLGSAIALALAVDDTRIQKLVLINPIPEFKQFIRRVLLTLHSASNKIPKRFAEALIHARLYNLATFLLHARKRKDINYAKTYLKHQSQAQYSLKAWRDTGTAIYELDQQGLAKQLTVPTLVLHGDLDMMTSARAIELFTEAFQNASLQRFADTGHFMHMEQPEAATAAARDFLAQ